jgi:AcrR family transcriptional regulator
MCASPHGRTPKAAPVGTQARIAQAAIHLFARTGGTDISVKDLAQQAGVARGTIYNNIPTTDNLFDRVATQLTAEMIAAVVSHLKGIEDPARRLALGIKLYLTRAHEEPDWANFLIRCGMSHATFRALWEGSVGADLRRGIKSGRYKVAEAQVPVIISVIGCSVVGGMHLIRDGIQTWKEAAKDVTEVILRGLGVPPAEARKLAELKIG